MKKLLYSSLLMIFLLSACAGNATPVATVVPSTQTPAAQVFITQVPASQLPPTQVPATAEPIVTNPAGCTDSASFVEDVTVPDNTNFNHGDVIHKVWRVKNSGTCAWNAQYTLVFASGDEMDAHASTPLSATQPGDTLGYCDGFGGARREMAPIEATLKSTIHPGLPCRLTRPKHCGLPSRSARPARVQAELQPVRRVAVPLPARRQRHKFSQGSARHPPARSP